MDLEIIMLSEGNQGKTNIRCYHMHVEPKKKEKNDTNELIYKTEREQQTLKTNL